MTKHNATRIFIGFILGLITTYLAFYFQATIDSRARVADTLARFYSSAAAEYYANYELRDARDNAPVRVPALYAIYDQDYKAFLSGSTELAAIVPPQLKDEVLGIEDTWDSLPDEQSTTSEAQWFNALDKIREDVLNRVYYNRLLSVPWR